MQKQSFCLIYGNIYLEPGDEEHIEVYSEVCEKYFLSMLKKGVMFAIEGT